MDIMSGNSVSTLTRHWTWHTGSHDQLTDQLKFVDFEWIDTRVFIYLFIYVYMYVCIYINYKTITNILNSRKSVIIFTPSNGDTCKSWMQFVNILELSLLFSEALSRKCNRWRSCDPTVTCGSVSSALPVWQIFLLQPPCQWRICLTVTAQEERHHSPPPLLGFHSGNYT